jgi:hypothetical protein
MLYIYIYVRFGETFEKESAHLSRPRPLMILRIFLSCFFDRTPYTSDTGCVFNIGKTIVEFKLEMVLIALIIFMQHFISIRIYWLPRQIWSGAIPIS